MLQSLLSQARALLFQSKQQKPVWGDSKHLDSLWSNECNASDRKLGTVLEVMQTLDEYEKVFADHMEYIHLPFSRRDFCQDTGGFRDKLCRYAGADIIGDVSDVSWLFGKRLPIGYVIETDPVSGLQKEVIESIERRLVVLRRNGIILSAYPCSIIRMESRGGINIM